MTNKTIDEPMKQKLKTRNIFLIFVLNLIQMQNLDLPDYLLINYPNSKTSDCLYYNIPERKNKKVCSGNFSFHLLEIEQIEKNLIEISKFELSIEKTI